MLATEVIPDRAFTDLARELHKVHPELTFEFGPQANRRDFVISAGGIKSAFPAVLALFEAAPPLDRWHTIAFRPRREHSFISEIRLRDTSVSTSEVEFTLFDDGGTAGIFLFLPNFREDEMTFQEIGYLLLDHALGEYDVETRLGHILILDPSQPTEGERHPLADLPRLFDILIAQLDPASSLKH